MSRRSKGVNCYCGKNVGFFTRLQSWYLQNKKKTWFRITLKIADWAFFILLLFVVVTYSDTIKLNIDRMLGNDTTRAVYYEDRAFGQAVSNINFKGLQCNSDMPSLTESTVYYVTPLSSSYNKLSKQYKETNVQTDGDAFAEETSKIFAPIKSTLTDMKYFSQADDFTDSMSFMAMQASNENEKAPIVFQYYIYADGSQTTQTIYSININKALNAGVDGFAEASTFLREVPGIEVSADNLMVMVQIAQQLAYVNGSQDVVLLNEDDTCRVVFTVTAAHTEEATGVFQTFKVIYPSKLQ